MVHLSGIIKQTGGIMSLEQFRLDFEPQADPNAIVEGIHYRFTVLTPRLIRLEFSPTGEFEDRASQVFWHRRQEVPVYKVQYSPKGVEIETEALRLTWEGDYPLEGIRSLRIAIKENGVLWDPTLRTDQSVNLHGTARTLDGAGGPIRLEAGLIARQGWAVVDDSASLVFDAGGWLEPRSTPDNIDLYFFGYGDDYPAGLQDYVRITGPAPLIPRWMLGNWWSRYWAYTQTELESLMEEFRSRAIPLSVCIVDMDWHITRTENASSGWTGYTWNQELFPDPKQFIRKMHGLGLRTALNLHPADGIHPHEEAYPDFAHLLQQDPALHQPIPFDPANRKFIDAYFRLLHHPQEDLNGAGDGIDFWWIDWQQGTASQLRSLDPLPWLNHLHFQDHGRDGVRRPVIFSRWGGLGSHRNPIGFSGDTLVTWEALGFLPYFTAAAANVAYGWWSHDIGGHMGGIEDDELYARWVQFGAFSPILRLHSTNSPYTERLPWKRGPAAERAATAALRLRHTLIPYLYSLGWQYHQTGISPIRPMYYSHPKEEAAYRCKGQYWFGSELIAAPVTSPAGIDTGLSRQPVWLPEGVWTHFFTGERVRGNRWIHLQAGLEDIPVFAKAGAIVPLSPETGWGGVNIPDSLDLVVFPGAEGSFDLYEDDGETTAYLTGETAITSFRQKWDGGCLTFTLQPPSGQADLIPAEREFRILMRGVEPPDSVRVQVNGAAREVPWIYRQETRTIELGPLILHRSDSLRLEADLVLDHSDRTRQTVRRMLQSFQMDSWVKAEIDRDWAKIRVGEILLSQYPQLSNAQRMILEDLARPDLPV
jgi:hypothetical protein